MLGERLDIPTRRRVPARARRCTMVRRLLHDVRREAHDKWLRYHLLTISIASEDNNDNLGGAAAGSIASHSFSVNAGDAIALSVWYNNSFNTITTPTGAVSDNVNGTWGAAKQTHNDLTYGSGQHYNLEQYVFANSASGTVTITVTFTGGTTTGAVLVAVVRNAVAGSAALDAFNLNDQSTPGTGADGLTVSATSSTNPSLLYAVSVDTHSLAQPGTNGFPSAGTGFTAGTTTAWFNNLVSENKRVTSTGSQTATATAQFNEEHVTMLLVFTEVQAPTITSQPVSVTVPDGQTATFSVTATASPGGGSLSYQWHKNGSNVGTNSSSYTTPVLNIADDPQYIYVTVTDSNGSIDSNQVYARVVEVPPAAWFRA